MLVINKKKVEDMFLDALDNDQQYHDNNKTVNRYNTF